MKILAVIVTYNGMEWVDRCIGSLLDSADRKYTLDVCVVDNGSTDGTPDYIAKIFPDVKVIRNKENLGFGAANNIAIKEAVEKGYDFVYLLNQDAWLLPDAMQALVDAARRGRKWAVLSPLQMQADGVAYDPQFGRRNAPKEGRTKPYRVRRVMAAHWLLRLSALAHTGMFAPIFEHYGEDDNLCARLRASGWKIGVVPTAKGIHDRAQREEPIEKIIRRNHYVKCLVDLCNPNLPLWMGWCKVFVYTIVKTFKYRSLQPFKYFGTLRGQGADIRRTREMKK